MRAERRRKGEDGIANVISKQNERCNRKRQRDASVESKRRVEIMTGKTGGKEREGMRDYEGINRR